MLGLVASDLAYRKAAPGELLRSLPDAAMVSEEYSFPIAIPRGLSGDPLAATYGVTFNQQGTDVVTFPNWEVIRNFGDQSTGFSGLILRGLYSNEGQQRTDYIVAFRGSDGGDGRDWYANLQLGKNQWAPFGTALIESLSDLTNADGSPFSGSLHFTGQSLGGALAQYAAYDYANSRESSFDRNRIVLTTFNAFAAAAGLQGMRRDRFRPETMAGVLTAHYTVENDIVHLLGGLFSGSEQSAKLAHGHLNATDASTGTSNLYHFDSFRAYENGAPKPGPRNYLGLVEGHRIETGFYAGFDRYATNFTGATNGLPIKYANLGDLQRTAEIFARTLGGDRTNAVSSWARIVSGGLLAALIGSPTQFQTAIDIVSESRYRSGDMSAALRFFLQSGFPNMLLQLAGKPFIPLAGAGTLVAALSDLFNRRGDAAAAVSYSNTFLERPASTIEINQTQPHNENEAEAKFRVAVTLMNPEAMRQPLVQQVASQVQSLNLNLDAVGTAIYVGQDWALDTARLLHMQAAQRDGVDATSVALLDAALLGFEHSQIVLAARGNAEFLSSARAQLVRFVTEDLGWALANANADFTSKYQVATNVFADTVTDFQDYSTVEQALQAAMGDPRFDGIRDLIGRALDIGNAAWQSVVVKPGIPTEPGTLNFDPDATGSEADQILDQEGGAYTLFLAYEASAGGQRVRINLDGANAAQFKVIAHGEEIGADGGVFHLTVQEGRRSVSFVLAPTDDFEASGMLAIDATLVDSAGVATHGTHREVTLTTVDLADPAFSKVFNAQPLTRTLSGRTDPETLETSDPATFRTQINGTSEADVIVGDHASEEINAGAGNDYIFEQAGSGGFYRGADTINAGAGNDWVFGTLGGTGTLIDVGDGDNVVKLSPGPQFLTRFVVAQGHPILSPGLYTGTGPLGDFYSDFAATLAVSDLSERPTAGANGALQFGIQYVFDGADGSGTSRTHQYFAVPEDMDELYPGTYRNDAAGGASYSLTSIGDSAALLTYEGGVTPATYRIDIEGAVDEQAPQSFENITIKAGAGNDRLFGARGRDFIQSGGGNDRISGYEGHDTLLAGRGDDMVIAGEGDDYVDVGSGSNLAWGEAGDDALLGGSGNDQLTGDSDSTPAASQGDDYLDGGGGDDLLAGNGGDDELLGGDGNDQLVGGAGNDNVDGEGGDDALAAGVGDDRLFGGSGDDQLDAADGNDYLDGESGNDTLTAGAGDDTLFGGAGDDRLAGDEGSDFLNGEAGDDTLAAGGGDDTLLGGSGDDVLLGGSGNDTYILTAGSGMDSVSDVVGSNVLQIDDYSELRAARVGVGDLRLTYGGADAVVLRHGFTSSSFSFQVGGSILSARELLDQYSDEPLVLDGNEILTAGGDALFPNMVLLGTGHGDTLNAGGLDGVVLDAGVGDDVLVGGVGDDLLHGGDGEDLLTGQRGDDALFGGEGNDRYVFAPGDGNDTIDDADGVSTITFSGPVAASQITAQLLADEHGEALHLQHNSEDSIRLVRNGANLADFVFAFGDGTRWSTQDLMQSFLEAPVVAAAGDSDTALFGSAYGDELLGGFGDDVLEGGAGSDLLAGGDGDDRYVFESGDSVDTISDASGSSKVEFRAGVSPEDIGGQFVADPEGNIFLEVQYTAADRLRVQQVGANLVDYSFTFTDGTQWTMGNLMEAVMRAAVQLSGGESEAVLFGSRFDDTLSSGPANDFLLGGAGDDTYMFNVGGGVDRIRDLAGINTLVFGAGITREMLALAPGSLRISVGDGGDAVVLETFDAANPLAGADVQNFVFADGDVATLEELLAPGFAFRGTEGDDVLRGTDSVDTMRGEAGADVLSGRGGKDTLWGGDGDDVLIGVNAVGNLFGAERFGTLWDDGNTYLGGEGDDVLWASAGTDVFHFEAGAGQDVVTDAQHDLEWFEYGGRVGDGSTLFARVFPADDASAIEAGHEAQLRSTHDTLRFGAGITPANVVVWREPGSVQWASTDDLVFRVGEGDAVRFRNWFRAEVNQLNRVEFESGRVWNLATIYDRLNGVPESENSAPVLANPIENPTATEDSPFAFEVPADTFADPEGDLLAYQVTRSDGSLLPAWLLFDPQTRTLSGTPLQSDVGTIELRATAADSGFEVSDAFTLTVLNVNDAPTVAVPLGSRSYAAGTPFVFAVPVGTYEDEDGSPLSLSAGLFDGGQLPDWLTFEPASGTFSGNPEFADIGLSRIAVTATDAAGESAIADFALIVRAPDGSTARGGAGDDVIHGGGSDETLIARGGDDYVYGDQGNDLLRGGNGNDLLQGGEGNDTLRGGSGQNVLDGGAGDDVIHGGVGSAFIAGGIGNDELRVGQGNDVIAFNAGDGIDTLYGGRDGGNTLSLGGGIGYDDLSLSKVGKDLVLNIGAADRMVLKNWYSGNTSVLNLQLIHAAAAEFDATSSDPLRNKRVQAFDFVGLVTSFDAARAASPGVTSWALTNALLQWHLSHSDDAALGGALAYAYGKNGGLSGISVEAAQQAIGATGFGADAQALRPFAGLQEGFAKLA